MRKPDLLKAQRWAKGLDDPSKEDLQAMLALVVEWTINLEKEVSKTITALARAIYDGG